MRILCATDMLTKSDPAIERAAILSEQLDAALTLLHVVVPGASPKALEETLQWASSQLRDRAEFAENPPRSTTNVSVQIGNAARTILDAAALPRTSLLVLGPHRPKLLRDALEGTIAEKAIATKKHPVLVVRGDAQRPYRRVLLALDASEASAAAVRAAEALVLPPGVSATVVHAHKPPYEGLLYSSDTTESSTRYAGSWKSQATHSVRELLRYESKDPARYDLRVERMLPAQGILRAVRAVAPDLLVMGTRGGGRLRYALIGSVANQVLQESDCDVLIVPEGSLGPSRSKLKFGGRRALRAEAGKQEAP